MFENYEYIFLLFLAGVFVSIAQRIRGKNFLSSSMTSIQGLTYIGIFFSFLILGLTEEQRLYTISTIVFVALLTTLVLFFILKINSERKSNLQETIPVLNIFISLFMNWGVAIVYSLWRLQLL